jgi:hypothetical protein
MSLLKFVCPLPLWTFRGSGSSSVQYWVKCCHGQAVAPPESQLIWSRDRVPPEAILSQAL